MKRTKHAIFAFVTGAAMFALTGCGDSKQVTEVKALPFGDANMTVDQALDTRKICDSVDWEVKQDDRNQTYVEYTCKYKDLSDSAFLARDKTTNAESAGDVYQWTYGPNGEPTLTAAGFTARYSNGTVKDFKVNPNVVMQLAISNTVSSFDEAWSTFFNTSIPKKPAKDITDTTYGNKLNELYPDESPAKAAAEAIYWKGAPNVQVGNFDKLGYPLLVASTDNRFLFPVDPSDVQVAVKVDPAAVDGTAVSMPQTPDKLFCVNQSCYDSFNNLHFLVGTAPASVVARETTPAPAPQVAAQPDSPSASLGQALAQAQGQAAQPTAPASASTADADLPTGSQDWPTMTPCIQKLEDAAKKQAAAAGVDDTISIDAANEMANTCKTLGQ